MSGKEESNPYGPHLIGRLLAHVHKYTRRFMTENLEQYGIDGSTYGFLFFLYHQDGLTEKEITRYMLVDKATTTRAISKLEKSGYLKREKDENDRRSYKIFLTPRADRMRPHLLNLRNEWNSVFLGCLEEDEREDLLELLTRIEQNLHSIQEMEGNSR